MRSVQEIERVLRDVQGRLDVKRQSTGIDLRVPPDGYHDDEDWLSVIVTPSNGGVRASAYAELLGEVEQEMRTDGVRQVILVPAVV